MLVLGCFLDGGNDEHKLLMLLAVIPCTSIERLGYPVSDNGNGIGDDDVTIESVDVIVSHIARLCAVLNTRHKLAVSCNYQTA